MHQNILFDGYREMQASEQMMYCRQCWHKTREKVEAPYQCKSSKWWFCSAHWVVHCEIWHSGTNKAMK